MTVPKSARRAARWPTVAVAIGAIFATLTLVPGSPGAAQTADDAGACENPATPGVRYADTYDDPNITWTDVTPPQSSQAASYSDIFFLNGQQGWAVGSRGAIVFTTDGGLTWKVPASVLNESGQPLTLHFADFAKVFFIDGQNGWVVANNDRLNAGTLSNPGLVLRTRDGGLTWHRQDLPNLDNLTEWSSERDLRLVGLSVVAGPPASPPGTELAWISGESTGPDGKYDRGVLFRTTNAGDDWTISDPGRPLRQVRFFDASNGLATAQPDRDYDETATKEEGAIFATDDGGTSWTLEWANPRPDDNDFSPTSPAPSGGFDELAFTDRLHGYASWVRQSGVQWFMTWSAKPGAGGGRVWKEERTCVKKALDPGTARGRNCPPEDSACNGLVASLVSSSAFGISSPGNFSRTSDGGAHWIPDRGPRDPPASDEVQPNLGHLSYPAPTVAYAAGFGTQRGRIFKASIALVEVTSVEPKGALCPGTVATIRGKGFTDGRSDNGPKSTVSFGLAPVPPEDVEVVSSTVIKANVPRRAGPDKVHVTVTTPDSPRGNDGLGTSLPNGDKSTFTYQDPTRLPPIVSGLSRKEGKLAGGDSVVISGERLDCATGVVFRDRTGKSVPASDVKVVPNPADPSKPRVVVTTPEWPHAAGQVDVVVSSAALLGPADVPSVPEIGRPEADDFTYLALPAISAVNPPRGSALGGTKVTIKGTGFEPRADDAEPEVVFDDAKATGVTVDDDGRTIAAILPPHAPGPVRVKVSTARRGASVPVPQFTYHPGISGIFPPAGPTTGGTEVTIAGKGFAGTTEVLFGNDAVKFTERSDNELVAVAPPHGIPEAVPVRLTASGLSSLPEDVFYTYGLVTPAEDPPDGDPAGGPLNEQLPGVQTAPPGGSPAATPSLSSAPSPVPSGSPAPGPSPVPGGAGAAGASAAPGASAGQAPSSVNAPVGAALPVPLASPMAAPGAAGQGAPGSGQGAVGSEDNDEAQGARRYAMSDASAGLALGGASAVGCFSWLALARRSLGRRRRQAAARRARPKGAY